MARIQQHNNDDDTLSETSEEEDNYGGVGKSMGFGSGYQKVNTAGLCYVFLFCFCLLYTSPSPRDGLLSRMPSSA